MKKVFPLSFLLLILTVGVAAQSGRRVVNPPPPREPVIETPPERPPERLAPIAEVSVLPADLLNHEIKSLDKSSFRLSDFNGHVIVVNIWATWCGPCRREVPDYERVRKEYAGKAVEFIGLTTEDPRTASDKVQQFAREFNFGFRLGWADREMAHLLMNGRSVIPQTLVIGADGRIVAHWNGYASGQSRGRLRDTIARALAEGPSSSPQSR
ncbi:MAG TPA: TlpA disulfide reductase family protein [Pyrinomonadaceae bacterium]|nr:TlpA disulfide reductase family protein [Pyrinomonadaceae bacterium]